MHTYVGAEHLSGRQSLNIRKLQNHRRSGFSVRPVTAPEPSVAPVIPIVQDDASLVFALIQGDPRAPATLFDRYAALVQRVLVRTLGYHDPDRHDLLHDVFVRALEGIRSLKNPNALRHWLTGITVFTAQEFVRRRRRIGPPEPPDRAEHREATAASPEAVEAVRSLYAAMDQLGHDARAVFILKFVEGLTLDEVALACGVSFSTARRRVDGAEKRFREILPEYPALLERHLEKER
jgi:RNA polymerase sigma-70 factor (ECF subfamily)